MRLKARVDKNQSDIVQAFRRCGFTVALTHNLGGGFPDVVVARRGWTGLVEIKDGSKPPSARKLTQPEADFHKRWPGEIFIVESVDDVLELNRKLMEDI